MYFFFNIYKFCIEFIVAILITLIFQIFRRNLGRLVTVVSRGKSVETVNKKMIIINEQRRIGYFLTSI